jgi:hypothetical protein
MPCPTCTPTFRSFVTISSDVRRLFAIPGSSLLTIVADEFSGGGSGCVTELRKVGLSLMNSNTHEAGA